MPSELNPEPLLLWTFNQWRYFSCRNATCGLHVATGGHLRSLCKKWLWKKVRRWQRKPEDVTVPNKKYLDIYS
jgi:hypothetical protein